MKKLIVAIILAVTFGNPCYADVICEIEDYIEFSNLVLDEMGHAIAGWVREKDDVYYVEVTSSCDGGKTWNKPIVFSDKAESYDSPAIALDSSSGCALVAWTEDTSPDYPCDKYHLMVSQSKDYGVTWSHPVCISKTGRNFYNNGKPPLTLLPSGNALIGWNGGDYIEFLRTTDFGDTWISEKIDQELWMKDYPDSVKHSLGTTIKSDPYIVMLENGKAISVWSFDCGYDENFLVIASSKNFGKSWELVRLLETKGSPYQRINLAMNKSENAILSWCEPGSSHYVTYSNDGGFTWGSPINIGNGNGSRPTMNFHDGNQVFFACITLDEVTLSETMTSYVSLNGGVDWNSYKIMDLGTDKIGWMYATSLDSGKLILTWSQVSGAKKTTHLAVSSDFGITWALIGCISEPSLLHSVPKVALNSEGQAIVIWDRNYLGKGTMESAYSGDFGHTWN